LETSSRQSTHPGLHDCPQSFRSPTRPAATSCLPACGQNQESKRGAARYGHGFCARFRPLRRRGPSPSYRPVRPNQAKGRQQAAVFVGEHVQQLALPVLCRSFRRSSASPIFRCLVRHSCLLQPSQVERRRRHGLCGAYGETPARPLSFRSRDRHSAEMAFYARATVFLIGCPLW